MTDAAETSQPNAHPTGRLAGTCASCHFWHAFPSEAWGECRQGPPTAIPGGQRYAGRAWPMTVFDDDCGSHKPEQHPEQRHPWIFEGTDTDGNERGIDPQTLRDLFDMPDLPGGLWTTLKAAAEEYARLRAAANALNAASYVMLTTGHPEFGTECTMSRGDAHVTVIEHQDATAAIVEAAERLDRGEDDGREPEAPATQP